MITTKHYPLKEWAPYTYPPPAGSVYMFLTKTGIRSGNSLLNPPDETALAIKVESYPEKKKVRKEVRVWIHKSAFFDKDDSRKLAMAYTSGREAMKWAPEEELVSLVGIIEVEEDE